MSIMDTNIDIAVEIAPEEAWTPNAHHASKRRIARSFDPAVGSGSAIAASAGRIAPHGIVDDGYADSDDTSRWIERIERPYA